jgi:cytoskeletal protein CcmA (bactofilin family)
LLGTESRIEGLVEIAGSTRIEGSIKGDVKAQGEVVIGEKARLKSNISGTKITVAGVVFGNILASERIIIRSSALIIGDVITRRIQADEGCIIHGKVLVCQSNEQWERALSELSELKQAKPALEKTWSK